jgi:predicted ATP-grasp superfamily ATP-dependent carboligase
LWDIHAASPQESLRFLEELHGRIGRRAVLIATTDIGTTFVADHAEQLSKWFVFPVQDSGLVRSLCSKKAMYYLAKERNVPTPETAFLSSMGDVERYLTTARFPVVVKPTHSGPGAFRIRLVQTRCELVEFCESVWQTSTSSVMLQEYIPGDDEMTWVFNGYFDGRGECLVGLTGRKLRNYPPYFGPGSLGVCVHNEQVKQTTSIRGSGRCFGVSRETTGRTSLVPSTGT